MSHRKKIISFAYSLYVINSFVLGSAYNNIIVTKCGVNITKNENTDSIKYDVIENNCETCSNTDCISLIASNAHPTKYKYSINFTTFISESVLLKKGTVKNSDLHVLIAKFLNIYNLEAGCLENVPLLKYIYFSNNDIQKIGNGIFNNLNDQLEVIDLTNNKISEIEEGAFSDLIKLKYVLLEYNKLTVFDNDWFRNSVNVNKFIVLSNNQINGLAFKSCLESGNFFTRIFKRKKDSFCASTKYIDLSYNNINTFNGNWFEQINNITTLVLSHNKIEIILKFSKNYFEKLENLYLNRNSLKYIEHDALGNIRNLKKLQLSENLLTTFNSQWFGFTSFYYPLNMDLINISYNKIEQLLPSTFDFKIKQIDLSSNIIHNVDPDAFSRKTDLHILNLSHNKLTSIGRNWLDIKTLERIDLSHNKIEKIYSHAMFSLPNLKILDVSFNKIVEVENFIGPNKNLEVVDLMSNIISSLHSDTFGAKNLKELRLQMNDFSYLPEDFFEKNNINKIYLHPNPWQCQCLQEIEKSASARNVTIRDSYDRIGEENYVLWIGYYPSEFPVCTVTKYSTLCVRRKNEDTIKAKEKYFKKVLYDNILVIKL